MKNRFKRREFFQRLAVLGAASGAPAVNSIGSDSRSPKLGLVPPKSKIGYIRTEIPTFHIPPYSGDRYSDTVPDTYDIAERAKLAVDGLTELTDPAVDHDIYFLAVFYRNPPVLRHETSDLFVQPKFAEALPLMRTITGSDLNLQVDRAWEAGILKSIGPDGLYYIATEGRPWIREGISAWTPYVLLSNGTMAKSTEAPLRQITNQVVCGRNIGVMTLYYLRDRNPMWNQIICRMIDRWSELAIYRDDYCYYPVALFVPNSKIDPHFEPPTGMLAAESGHRLIQGLAQYYRVSGYEPARILAAKLCNYVRYHAACYDSQGRFINQDPKKIQGHFHSHTFGLLSMLEYALAADDRELAEFVKESYEWARNSTYGCPLTGWYPEAVAATHPYCEGCCMADMIALALKLTGAGVGDYWDDVDRWVRNQFAEGQFTETRWVNGIAQELKPSPVGYNETADHAAERSIGAFSGYTTGDDYGISQPGAMAPTGVAGCCAGNCTRTIYYVWEHMVDYESGHLRLNLLLNRASAWVDVHSYIPYEGRVDLKIRQPCQSVLVRVPEWIEAQGRGVVCTVNGKSQPSGWEGRYVILGAAKPGDTFTVTFPLSERTVRERIGGADYSYIFKGNTAVSVDPPGKYYGLYRRDQYRGGPVRWRKVERFVSTQQIAW